MRVKHTQELGSTNLYPAITRVVGHGSKVREGMVWQWEKGKAYSEVPAQALLEEMSYWDDISPKRGKDELESLDACHRS